MAYRNEKLKGYFMVTYSVTCALGPRIFSWEGWYCIFPSFPGNETGVCEWDVPLCCDGVSEVRTVTCTCRVFGCSKYFLIVTKSLEFP